MLYYTERKHDWTFEVWVTIFLCEISLLIVSKSVYIREKVGPTQYKQLADVHLVHFWSNIHASGLICFEESISLSWEKNKHFVYKKLSNDCNICTDIIIIIIIVTN